MAQSDLVPLSERTKEEQKKICTKGGIASGKARRAKKSMREWAEVIGALPTKVICPDGEELRKADLDADAIMQQYRKAHNGDTRAVTFLAGLKGELKQEQVSANATVVNVNTTPEGARNIQGLSTDAE